MGVACVNSNVALNLTDSPLEIDYASESSLKSLLSFIVEIFLFVSKSLLYGKMIRKLKDYIQGFGQHMGQVGITLRKDSQLEGIHLEECVEDDGTMIPPLVCVGAGNLYTSSGLTAHNPMRMLSGHTWPGRLGKLSPDLERELLVRGLRGPPGRISRLNTLISNECDVSSLTTVNACVPDTSYAIASHFTSQDGDDFYVQYAASFANFGMVPILIDEAEKPVIISTKQIETLGYTVNYNQHNVQVTKDGVTQLLGDWEAGGFI